MTDVLPPTPEGLERAAALLRDGEMVAFPTDTVYGVGISAAHPERIEALLVLKQRPAEKRIPILVADLGQAVEAGWEADERAHRLSTRFWPGALTLVLATPTGETQAFRAPDHPVALDLIRRTGPILATSANRSGEPDTLDADDVLIAFATQPHFVYAHKWRQGDILIWDNRCTLHRGTEYDSRNHKRDMRRATVNEAGEDRSAIPAGLSLQMLAEQAKAPAS